MVPPDAVKKWNLCADLAARYGVDSLILDFYALGDLEGEEAAAIRRHLAQCQSCWQQVAATKASLVDTRELAAGLTDVVSAVKLLPHCADARQRFPGTYQSAVVYVAHALALPLDADEDAWVTAHAPTCPICTDALQLLADTALVRFWNIRNAGSS